MHDDTERKNRAILEAIDIIHGQGLLKDDDLKDRAARAREERDPEIRATLVDQLLVEVRRHDNAAVRELFDRLIEDDALRGWYVGDSKPPGRGGKSTDLTLTCLTCDYENHLAYEPADDEPTDCQNPDLPRHQLKLS